MFIDHTDKFLLWMLKYWRGLVAVLGFRLYSLRESLLTNNYQSNFMCELYI